MFNENVDFYPTPPNLIEKMLNCINWNKISIVLEPSYGKCKYEDMSKEEKAVVDEFEGKDNYSKTMKNLDYYLYNPSKILMLN